MKKVSLFISRGLALFLCIVLSAALLPTAALAGGGFEGNFELLPVTNAYVTVFNTPAEGRAITTEVYVNGGLYVANAYWWRDDDGDGMDDAFYEETFSGKGDYYLHLTLRPDDSHWVPTITSVMADPPTIFQGTLQINGEYIDIIPTADDGTMVLDWWGKPAEPYTGINVTYNHQGIRADVGEELTLKARTDIPSVLLSGAPSYQWYKAGSNYYGTGTAIPGATGSSYKVPTSTTGMSYYYCVVTAKLKNGTTVNSADSDSPIIWVNVQNIGDGFDAYHDGESDTYISYWSGEEFTFSPGQMNDAGKTVTYQWYECDAEGFPIREAGEGGRALLIFGISEDKMMQPIYYKCVATADGDKWIEKDEVLFSAVLYPMGVEEPIPFTDVPETEWYYSSVIDAYQMGLINGKTDTLYKPTDNMTYAEALKLAACMHQLYTDGEVTLTIGDPWYLPYFEYCYANGIISEENNEENGYKACLLYANEKVTRSEYALWFSRALPDEALAEKNDIPDNSIPDVAATNSVYDQAIYKLYRAGIVNGTDTKGTFKPESNILRSEVAAILVRMMAPDLRVGAPGELGK